MAFRLSRRKIAQYYTTQLLEGADTKKLSLELAAFLIESRRVNEMKLIVRDI